MSEGPVPGRAPEGRASEGRAPAAPAPDGHADLAGRPDLDRLLRRFYAAAFADPLIGPFFTDVAGTDLTAHLPTITDFWERALFRTVDYRGDVFAAHAVLHAVRPLTAAHFGRWVQLWHATVDGLHAGPRAERAKAQGERLAVAMLRRLYGPAADTGGGPGGFVPLAALRLRAAGPRVQPAAAL
ncbi:group III truncated hemoglobin [Streptomyces ochraceiscleroticus]|uniref:Group III truncated hemoglobin n=1 Tax=Streptomyces ochraceiscleroticus TaxID=47761 RepID=A0ABW1N173_9ACTN|nr:group III truncated hemoglobin [Streptomyces ochraceiscleroticus]